MGWVGGGGGRGDDDGGGSGSSKGETCIKQRGKEKNKSSEVKGQPGGRRQDRQGGNKQTVRSNICLISDIQFEKLSCSQEKKMYSAERIKALLQDTKNAKGVKLEEYFPNMTTFFLSARFHVNHKTEWHNGTSVQTEKTNNHESLVKLS